MRVISHPLRFDSAGSIVTIEDGSARHAAELAGVVVATGMAERPLAPEYGLPDPTGHGVSADVVAAAVSRCEPELIIQAAKVEANADSTATVHLSVTWSE